VLQGPAHEIEAAPIPPDGRPEIIVHVGDRWAERDAAGNIRMQARTLFAGQLTRAVRVIPLGYARVAGAHLRPHGGFDLLGLPQHRFTNQIVDLRTVDLALARALRREVAAQQDARGMIEAFTEILQSRVGAGVAPGAAHKAVAIALALKGMISVSDLARAAGVSDRQLERLFRERVGLSPKQFVRIVRFQEVLRATRSGSGPDVGWAAIALEHGFYDQAHFINDFKSFVGRTPGKWRINHDSLAAIFSTIRRAPLGGFFQASRRAFT
jgi:AraC-like DNA-binding protein